MLPENLVMQEEGRHHPFCSRGPERTLKWLTVILEDFFCDSVCLGQKESPVLENKLPPAAIWSW